MDFSSALPTFVVTLREGVEAALVVGIVLAYLEKAQQTRLNPWVYGGVGVGIVASAIVGVLFNWTIQALESSNPKYAPTIEPLLEGIFSLMAIALLSWMLIWMTQQARSMKSQVEGAIGSALKQSHGAERGIFGLIFFAVLREGFETVLFIATKFQQGFVPAVGAISGLIVAVGIGVLLFQLGVKINIRLFFQVMGVLLLLIVSGLVISALGHFDTAITTLAQMSPNSESLCFYHERFTSEHSCVLGPQVWNTSATLPQKQFPGVVLHALFGYPEKLYLVQAVSYVLFLTTIGGIYLQSITGWTLLPNRKHQPSPKTASSKQE